mgnify:CR=1 FL=1
MANNNLLKLENINKSFGNVKVLNDINLNIKSGEIVALVGDNGAGKSTLIKVITGIHSPNSGNIYFKNNLTVRWGDGSVDWTKRKIKR